MFILALFSTSVKKKIAKVTKKTRNYIKSTNPNREIVQSLSNLQ